MQLLELRLGAGYNDAKDFEFPGFHKANAEYPLDPRDGSGLAGGPQEEEGGEFASHAEAYIAKREKERAARAFEKASDNARGFRAAPS